MTTLLKDSYSLPALAPELVERAVERGIQRYIKSRKRRVPEFVDHYFSFRGAWRLHRKAFGRDLYRMPVNVIWSIPVVAVQLLAGLSRKMGAKTVAQWLDKLPKGFETAVQREVKWLIYTELLELPYCQGERESHQDALLAEILAEPALAQICEDYLERVSQRLNEPGFRATLEHNLSQLASARTAAADLATSILSLAAGYAAFHQATPGAISGGTVLAGAIAHQVAVSSFWLGPTLGAWYYSVFPVSASAGLLIASTGAVMATLALISTLAGLVVDPILAISGVHRRRLQQFIDRLGDELSGKGGSGLKIHDQYLARVFDILDLLRTAAMAAK